MADIAAAADQPIRPEPAQRAERRGDGMELRFSGAIWYWRGPAPWYFVTVPEEDSEELQEVSSSLTYGWGVIPVQARIGDSTWATSLFPKDGLYALPIKTAIRRAEGLDEGDLVDVVLTTGDPVVG